MSVTIIGKVKRSDIIKALLKTIWPISLLWYHYHIETSTPVRVLMILFLLDAIYDIAFVVLEYRKQGKAE